MKIKLLYLILIYCFPIFLFSQVPLSPSVSSSAIFESYPVDLSTGIPQISVPIYSMPTRSKDININMSLNYHPSSISNGRRRSGDAGRGWNITHMGAIYCHLPMDGVSLGKKFFSYSFMGQHGDFNLDEQLVNQTTFFTESDQGQLKGNVIYDSSTSLISGFKIYDKKGYIYYFTAMDDYIYVNGLNGNRSKMIYGYQITKIVDNNNQTLATFSYDTYQRSEPYHIGSEKNTYSILNKVNVPGFGVLNINTSVNPNYDNWLFVNNVEVKDYFSEGIRRFSLSYQYHVNLKSMLLHKVESSDFDGINTEAYTMFYKTAYTGREQSILNLDHDEWGYPSLINEYCPSENPASKIVDIENCNVGVLQKMILPSGGSVIYNFESNTYSHQYGRPLDLKYSPRLGYYTDPAFYTNMSLPENKYNFAETLHGSKHFSSLSPQPMTLTFTETTSLYLRFDGERYDTGFIVDGQPLYGAPNFSLRQGTTVIRHFYGGSNYGNDQNNCRGWLYTFQPGTYTIQMTNTSNTTGSVRLYRVNNNQVVNKWWYGGGLRIKNIAFFDGGVPQDYYESSNNSNVPAREITYDYSLPSDSSRSSGSLVREWVNNGLSTSVWYKYVTTYETGSNGKILYSFINDIDQPSDFSSTDYRFGKVLNMKIYNDENFLQKEVRYGYDSQTTSTELDTDRGIRIISGSSRTSKIETLEYFPSATLIKQDSLVYNSKMQLTKKVSTTSNSSKENVTKYHYHVGNSSYSDNRIDEIDYIETLENDDLLSTTKVIYNDTWTTPGSSTVINQSFLPSMIQFSKGEGTLETRTKINLYDRYSHPLETENESGIKTSYIWGYNNSQVIAEIKGISHTQIPSSLMDRAILASNAGNESLLLSRLNDLRNSSQLSSAMVTTYTYRPLVGVTSITDPNGYKVTYEYDENNKVKFVKDHEGNIITENQYNNKAN